MHRGIARVRIAAGLPFSTCCVCREAGLKSITLSSFQNPSRMAGMRVTRRHSILSVNLVKHVVVYRKASSEDVGLSVVLANTKSLTRDGCPQVIHDCVKSIRHAYTTRQSMLSAHLLFWTQQRPMVCSSRLSLLLPALD
jgi:hypothetical protein